MWHSRFIFLFCFAVMLAPFVSHAQITAVPDGMAGDSQMGVPQTGDAQDSDFGRLPNKFSLYPPGLAAGQTDPGTGLPYAPPAEPAYPQIKYLKMEEPEALQEKIDRLLYGATAYVKPEFDYYGYEIRRYMSHIGNPDVYATPAQVEDELNNVHKAKIVFRYWQDDLAAQRTRIEKAIDAEDASSSARGSYKYNSAAVGSFELDCKNWLDKNEALLTFLSENQGRYTFKNPTFNFADSDSLTAFTALYDAREKALDRITKYGPFSAMIY